MIEDCRLTYGELVVQSYGDDQHYQNVQVRRNVIEKNYHINTCGQNSAYRPSGMYASHVNVLLIEGNLFDHNGWNEDVESACATMFNHNMYLNADNLVVRDNIIARASSMGIKMRSDVSGDADNLLFANNFFVDGEIGLGIGGNTSEAHRFSNVVVNENVFSQIGMGNPTQRSFAWMLDIADILKGDIRSNYFLHQPWYNNAYGIYLGGDSTSEININENRFYNLASRSLRAASKSGWSDNTVEDNIFVDPSHASCLVYHEGDFSTLNYSNNHYYSSHVGDWFCGDVQANLTDWQSASGETGANIWNNSFSDPDRTIASYAELLGLSPSLEAFIEQAREQSRLNWNNDLTAEAINTYIKAGFEY